jgi:hypothetical protein
MTLSGSYYTRACESDATKEAVGEEHQQRRKKKLRGVYVLANPVSGEETIKYPSDTADFFLRAFLLYTKEEQIEILNSEKKSIFPLADTLWIIDDKDFFPESIFYQKERNVFKIIRRRGKTEFRKNDFLQLYAVGVRNNDLIVSFLFNGNKEFYNCYFDLGSSSIKFFKSRFANNTMTRE